MAFLKGPWTKDGVHASEPALPFSGLLCVKRVERQRRCRLLVSTVGIPIVLMSPRGEKKRGDKFCQQQQEKPTLVRSVSRFILSHSFPFTLLSLFPLCFLPPVLPTPLTGPHPLVAPVRQFPRCRSCRCWCAFLLSPQRPTLSSMDNQPRSRSTLPLAHHRLPLLHSTP